MNGHQGQDQGPQSHGLCGPQVIQAWPIRTQMPEDSSFNVEPSVNSWLYQHNYVRTAQSCVFQWETFGRLVAADLAGKSIVLGHVRMLRTTLKMEMYLLSLLPPSIPKSPIEYMRTSLCLIYLKHLSKVCWNVDFEIDHKHLTILLSSEVCKPMMNLLL